MFYTFKQNNSYGSFEMNNKVTVFVIIEAQSATVANALAEDIGIYFDGEDDCPCCGDRWHEAYGEGNDDPTLRGDTPLYYYNEKYSVDWVEDANQAYCYVYYLDGRKVGYFRDPKTEQVTAKSV